MTTQQLLDYIKQKLKQGVSREEIKSSLVANGWQEKDIDEAFAALVNNPVAPFQSSLPQQTLTSLPGAISILGQTWAIYKQRLGIFLGIMIIPILLMSPISDVFVGRRLLIFTFLSSKLTAVGNGLSTILTITFLLIVLIIIVWKQTALLYAIKDSQERIGVLEAYRRGWRKILSYSWIFMATVCITLGGLLFFIVPGIIFAVWFKLATFVLIAEDLKGMNALFKSREYVRGKWGSVFWRFFFITALSFIISLALSFIAWLLKIPFGQEISQFLIGLFWTPFVTIYGFLVYSNLKTLKGEIVFAPTGWKKAKFIVVGIIGLFVFIVVTQLFFRLFLLRIFILENFFSEPPKIEEKRKEVHDRVRELHIQQIQNVLELYYDEHGHYPFSLNELSQYFLTIPVDPKTNLPYQYQRRSDKDYQLCAQLEAKTQKCVTPLLRR